MGEIKPRAKTRRKALRSIQLKMAGYKPFVMGFLHLFALVATVESTLAHRRDFQAVTSDLKSQLWVEGVSEDALQQKIMHRTATTSQLSIEGVDDDDISDRWKFRGVNLGGIFVIEPWITPSLFYQNKPISKTAIDCFRFCEVLGGEEANKQLQRHWDTFVTEEEIKELASYGINAVRLPVADWMYIEYPPYTNGCWKNSSFYVNRIIDWCGKYNVKVFIDLHAAIGGQNGFDNGGKARQIFWTGRGEYVRTFDPAWMFEDNAKRVKGETIAASAFEPVYTLNPNISYENLNFTLQTVEIITHTFSWNPTVVGILDVLNEPAGTTPLEPLKTWYRAVDKKIAEIAPHWIRIYGDSFRSLSEWVGPKGLPTPRRLTAIDTHPYEAWAAPRTAKQLFSDVCAKGDAYANARRQGLRIVVAEWSSATDPCTLWLNGWNYPRPVTMTDGKYDLCGARSCTPCIPRFPNKSRGDLETNGYGPTTDCLCPITAEAPKELIYQLYLRMMNAYSRADGWFFWNFKTENEDPRWSYLGGVRVGLIPKVTDSEEISAACQSPCKDAPSRSCDDNFAVRQRKSAASHLSGLSAVIVAAMHLLSGMLLPMAATFLYS